MLLHWSNILIFLKWLDAKKVLEHHFLTRVWIKNSMVSVTVHSAKWPGWYGQNFGVDGMGLRCFIKKVLLKISKNLQENTCNIVSC